MGKGKVIWIVPIIVILVIGVSYFYGWELSVYMNKGSAVDGIDELAALVNEQLDEGKTGARIYIKNVSETELNKINDYVCSVNGNVAQYTIQEKSRTGIKVKFKYDISDNYYVIGKYLKGEGIPGDRVQAVKLYEVTTELLGKLITEDMTDYDKELAIHDYIVKNCQYGYVDYSREYAYRAYGCLVQNKAVCNGYAEAMSLLLTCAGIENVIVTGEGREELHAWNQVCLDGKWYNVDATWDDPLPDRGIFVGHMFFNVTDDVMDYDHIWKHEDYNKCEDTAYNYYNMSDLVCDYNMAVAKVETVAMRDAMATTELVLTDYDPDKYAGFSFACDNPGIQFFSYSLDDYGDNKLVTLYLNQRQ